MFSAEPLNTEHFIQNVTAPADKSADAMSNSSAEDPKQMVCFCYNYSLSDKLQSGYSQQSTYVDAISRLIISDCEWQASICNLGTDQKWLRRRLAESLLYLRGDLREHLLLEATRALSMRHYMDHGTIGTAIKNGRVTNLSQARAEALQLKEEPLALFNFS